MIEVKNVKKVYPLSNKNELILNKVSFLLPDKGIYFILGKSGSGKSTLLNLILGIERPDEGYIKIDGRRIDNLSDEGKEMFYKNKISILFQNFNLINDLTVKENLNLTISIKNMYIDLKGEYIKKLLIKFKLIDKLNQKTYLLSGGEKQRLALIRALINNPSIILVDEPTGALDKENQKIILDELKKLSEDKLILIVTHNKELVDKYGDGYLLIKEKSVKIHNIDQNIELKRTKKDKRKKRLSFYFSLLKRNLFSNVFKNIFTVISLSFTLLLSFFTFNFYLSINDINEGLIYDFPSYNIFSVSKVYNTSINGSSLSIERKEDIDSNEFMSFLNENEIERFSLLENYSYFLNNNRTIKINDIELESVTFLPSFDVKNGEVIVNEAFIDKYLIPNNFPLENILNEGIELNVSSFNEYISFSNITNTEVSENLDININFLIKHVSKEFSYLSTPRVYYSYDFFERYLLDKNTTTISLLEGNSVSYFDLVNRAKENDSITSFSSYLLLHDEETYLKVVRLINENTFKKNYFDLSNDSLTIINSFNDIINILFVALNFFIVIIALTSIFIIFSITFYNYLSHKKERAILKVLGSNEASINLVYIFEVIILYLLSFIISYLIYSNINQKLFNLVSKEVGITLFCSQHPFLYILIFLVLLIITCLTTYLPLRLSKKNKVVNELKEE